MTDCNCHPDHHERGTHAPTQHLRQEAVHGSGRPPAVGHPSPARKAGAALYLYVVVPAFAVAFPAAAVWALTG